MFCSTWTLFFHVFAPSYWRGKKVEIGPILSETTAASSDTTCCNVIPADNCASSKYVSLKCLFWQDHIVIMSVLHHDEKIEIRPFSRMKSFLFNQKQTQNCSHQILNKSNFRVVIILYLSHTDTKLTKTFLFFQLFQQETTQVWSIKSFNSQN